MKIFNIIKSVINISLFAISTLLVTIGLTVVMIPSIITTIWKERK
jgi:hypothetical protein